MLVFSGADALAGVPVCGGFAATAGGGGAAAGWREGEGTGSAVLGASVLTAVMGATGGDGSLAGSLLTGAGCGLALGRTVGSGGRAVVGLFEAGRFGKPLSKPGMRYFPPPGPHMN